MMFLTKKNFSVVWFVHQAVSNGETFYFIEPISEN